MTAALRALGWWWGLPLSTLLSGWWLLAAWRIDPDHVWNQLWREELLGRITGIGTLGSPQGPMALLTSAPNMAWYYLTRFEPWCVLSILGGAALWRRDPGTGRRRWQQMGQAGAALHGAAVFVIVILAFFTLSAGKRADYIAGAYAPGSLLAAWWLWGGPRRIGVRLPWLAPLCAAAVLTGLTIYNELDVAAPTRRFGDVINRFVREAEAHLEAEPLPMVFWVTGYTHLGPFLGDPEPGGGGGVALAARRGDPFWVFAGRRADRTFEQWLDERPFDLELTERCRSDDLPPTTVWPGPVVMYRAVPVTRARAPAAAPAPR